MKNQRIDLHCHTNLSDGERSNSEILNDAKKAGINFLAVTDHDILNHEFPILAQKASIKSCEAIEVSINGNNANEVHLALYTKTFPTSINRIIEKTRQSRIGILEYKIDRLNDRAIRVNLEQFYDHFKDKGIKPECITLRDLAKYVYTNKKNTKLIKDVFGDSVCYDTFLKEFLNEDGEYSVIGGRIKCYFLPSIEEIKKNINTSNTVISLVHPQHIFKNTHEMHEKIGYYVDRGINAIEINSLAPKNWVHAIMNVKKNHNLILTTGSDNHSDTTDERHDEIGSINPELFDSIISEDFEKFINLIF